MRKARLTLASALTLALTTALLASSCTQGPTPYTKEILIIPTPNSIVKLGGVMDAQDTTENITFSIDTTIANDEGYRLTVKDSMVTIVAGSQRGYTPALATLEQLVDAEGRIPYVVITDAPRFEWRGVMLDVSRHFQDVDLIKRYIDILSFHKLNKFHLHLTDGIGWRIEIKAYPELTRRGAWRKIKDESVPYVDFELSEQGAANTYGGYYTRADIEEIVNYAASKNIEVIPEIEMPGHSQAALECYPHLRCDESKSTDVYCAGNAQTFKFLRNIIDEVVEMFPSEYLHIGGDEVGFSDWEKCPKCLLISKDGAEVQKYFVQQIEKYVNSKGRRMIGWDEIARDELNSSSVVMSWTGWEGGMYAAKAGHDVIMSPLHYVYLDHYQGQNDAEPQAWGGNNSLKRVWSFPIIPFDMPAELASRVKGGQGNLWTETIQTSEHIEYMLLPRLSALGEALWANNREHNDAQWRDFSNRMERQFQRYDLKGWNYANSAIAPQAIQNGDSIELVNELRDYPIHYTLDGSDPSENSELYTRAIKVDTLMNLRAIGVRNGKQAGNELNIANLHHKATGAHVIYNIKPSHQYHGGSDNALTDNRYATKRGDNKSWAGWQGDNLDVTIDLGDSKEISELTMRFFQHISTTSVMLPLSLSVEVSKNGENYKEVHNRKVVQSKELNAFIEPIEVHFTPTEARYVRVKAQNRGTLPQDNPRSGGSAWVFTDEIAIN